MRKFFGVLFLLVGLGLFGIGVAFLTAEETKHSVLETHAIESAQLYQRERTDLSMAGNGFLICGIAAYIIGIILCVSKSKRQREKEYELGLLQKSQLYALSEEQDIYAQIEKLGRLKAQGLLTEEEFVLVKRRLLGE
ncbi:MAG TPA: SHOCT domain-containing protein [Flavobacterium sp.]|jgi:hypothetical protein